jgi:hypothetical protein
LGGALSLNARKIFGLELPVINKNEKACLTLFTPERKKRAWINPTFIQNQ